MSVNATTALNVYEGETVTALTIDGDQSILYIADTGAKTIDSIQYDHRELDKSKDDIGLVETLYHQVHNLEYVTSLAVDFMGNIFWSLEENGLEDGVIMRAPADDPNPTAAKIISKTLDAAYSLCYTQGFLFYAGKETAIETVETVANIEEQPAELVATDDD